MGPETALVGEVGSALQPANNLLRTDVVEGAIALKSIGSYRTAATGTNTGAEIRSLTIGKKAIGANTRLLVQHRGEIASLAFDEAFEIAVGVRKVAHGNVQRC